MKIVLPKEEDGFRMYPHDFCGIPAILIVPEITAKWDKTNLHFRSLVVRADNLEVLSSGWPKFFNQGEKPDCYPDPEKFIDWSIEDKIDGSLLILDYVNGQHNMRTRGTVSHTTQTNAADFEQLFVKYPKLKNWVDESCSILFEIVTPNNVIVIRPNDIDFILLGGVWKDTLNVMTDADVLNGKIAYDLKRPKTYDFSNLTQVSEAVKAWKGLEGVVLSYNNNQNRVKLKSEWYLQLHRIKSELNSENNLIEFYVSEGMPTYLEFFNKIETTFDWEIANQLQGQISKLVDAGEEVKRIANHMKNFVDDLRGYKTRKEQALEILTFYGDTSRAGFAFKILSNKPLNTQDYIKLFWQILKK